MSTHLPGLLSFLRFLRHFVLAKLATSSVRVKLAQYKHCIQYLYYRATTLLQPHVWYEVIQSYFVMVDSGS